MLLLYAVTLSIGGIPLLYLGEEWGMLNDYDFVNDPAKAGDTRWIHRPKMRWEFLEELKDDGSIRKRIFTSAQRMIQLRKDLPALAGLQMELIATDNPHVLAYVRAHEGNRLLVLANFSDEPQTVAGNRLRTAGLGRFFQDRIRGTTLATSVDVTLEAYGFLWLERV